MVIWGLGFFPSYAWTWAFAVTAGLWVCSVLVELVRGCSIRLVVDRREGFVLVRNWPFVEQRLRVDDIVGLRLMTLPAVGAPTILRLLREGDRAGRYGGVPVRASFLVTRRRQEDLVEALRAAGIRSPWLGQYLMAWS